MGEELFHKVAKWTYMLGKEDKVEHALLRLESVKINLRLLSETGVGKAVNSLRKHPKWGDRVSALVSRWKNVARTETARIAAEAEKEKQEESEDEGEDGSSPEEEEEGQEKGHQSEDSQIHNKHAESKMDQNGGHRNKADNAIKSPVNEKSANRKCSSTKSSKNIGDNDAPPLDAFSAQLSAADRISKVKAQTKKKLPKISAESIQNSLLESLANPQFAQAVNQNHHHQQLHQPFQPSPSSVNLDINMFKKAKEQRRVYAGKSRKNGVQMAQEVPRLYDICLRLLGNNIDAIEETGSIPFHVLQPVLEKANSQQLHRIEEKNPYLQEETDYLWRHHCEREFTKELSGMIRERNSEDEEEEDEEEHQRGDYYEDDGLDWRQRFAKFFHERERKLRRLSKKIRTKTSELAEPQKKAMETAPIAPRYVRKRQIRNGMMVSASSVPTAIELTKARRQIFETGNDADLRQMPSAIRNTTSTLGSRSRDGFSTAKKKPQRGPLMIKTLKMLKKKR